MRTVSDFQPKVQGRTGRRSGGLRAVKGRHRSAGSSGGALKLGAAAVAVLVILAGSWYAFRKYSQPACGNAAKLSVGAPADIVPALKAQATEWSAQAKLDDNCVDVDVF